MPAEPSRRCQTSKQAKAAYKARGSTDVSTSERRQLARGAELLQRADRLKEQAQRRKEWQRRKEEKESKDGRQQVAVNLGTQMVLDRFDKKSSQSHLGSFLKRAPPPPRTSDNSEGTTGIAPRPYRGSDAVIMTNTVSSTNPSPDRTCAQAGLRRATGGLTRCLSTDWEEFLDSSTQIAREIDTDHTITNKTVPQMTTLSFSSFNSDDMLFDQLEDEEAVAQSNMHSPDSEVKARAELDRQMMPPPMGTSLSKNSQARRSPPKKVSTSALDSYGVSMADLEQLAASEILLTQWTPC